MRGAFVVFAFANNPLKTYILCYHLSMDENNIELKNIPDPFAYIRAVSAIIIFCTHTNIFSGMHGFQITEKNWLMKTPMHGAVWVFIFISGYFNIRGFLGDAPKYELSLKGIGNFYLNRFKKVLLHVWCFYLIALTISEPAFLILHPEIIPRLITFTYTGTPGCTSIAATWYCSTLAWLYLVTPFMAFLCRRLERIEGCLHLVLTAAFIAALGLAERLFFLSLGATWTQDVFVPFWCNLDIFICGMLAYIIGCRITPKLKSRTMYMASFLVFTIFLIIHCRILFLGDINAIYTIIHEYIMPTAYIIVLSAVCVMIQNTGYRYLPLTSKAIVQNPLRVIDAFSLITFQFYLIHSMVLLHLSELIAKLSGTAYHVCLLLTGFIITTILSVLFRRATTF